MHNPGRVIVGASQCRPPFQEPVFFVSERLLMSANKTPESSSASLAILGCGNLGKALARGLVRSGTLLPDRISIFLENSICRLP